MTPLYGYSLAGAAMLLLTVVCLTLVNRFIVWHEGRPVNRRLAIPAAMLFIVLCFLQLPVLFAGHVSPAIQAVVIYGFSLMFLLLDCSNSWLPLEFTAPFCIAGVLLTSSPLSAALLNLAMMGGLMTGYRLLLRRMYGADVLGKGDIWMMSGFAAFFSFTASAAVLVCGLTALLLTGRLLRRPALPLAPFVLPFSVLLCVMYDSLPLTWRLL
ncbi:hypothetical protein ACIPMZ_21195 [Scandinavium goeteborgense]|uniref:hypothetical protein n=1 Tax=Scandinavium goeteborgense TaxID=1851514 RepID=UPI0037F30148